MPTRRTWLTLLLANTAAAGALVALAPWSPDGQPTQIGTGSGVAGPVSKAGSGSQVTNVMTSTGPQVVTPLSPGVFRLELPAASDGGRHVLRIAVSGYKPADPPANDFRVEMRASPKTGAVRVGSFAIFPSVAFAPGGPQPHRGFVFDLTKPLSDVGVSSGNVEIIVTAVPARASASAATPVGDTLTVANVSIELRKFQP